MTKLRIFLLLLLIAWAPAAFAQNMARMLSTPNARTGTSYTFVAADTTRVVTFNNSSAVAVALPNGAAAGFGAGTMLSVMNLGAGTVTITCSSCTINGVATLPLSQNQGADIYGGSGNPAVNYVALPSPSGASFAVVNANNTFSGNNTFANISAVQFVDGVTNTTVQQAINNLPATGGTVMALNPAVGLSLGSIDPGTKAVTLYLAPANYTLTQLTLRSNFHLIGSGSNSSAVTGTVITSTSTTTPPIVLGGTVPIAGVVLQGFRLEGGAGNTTQNGINIIAQINGGGLWYSILSDIMIGATIPFGGIGLNFDGSAGGTPHATNQFDSIRDVRVFRKSGGSFALQVLGANGQFSFDNCQFDGQAQGDGTNTNIASSSSTIFPYSLGFNELTSQGADVGVNISGAIYVTFRQGHHEKLNGGYLLSLGTGGVNDYGITVEDSAFQTVGSNSGAGYLVKGTMGATNGNLNFINNSIGNSPDAVLVGFTTNVIESGTMAASGAYRPNQVQTLSAPTLSGLTNGTGLQLFNTATTCTTAATINTACTTAAITLPVAYADTNYRLSVMCLGPTQFPQVQTVTKSNTTFTITLNNLTAAAASCSSFDVSAVHN